MHLIAQVGYRLWLRDRRDLLEQRFSEVPLPVGVVQEERVRLEVVYVLVSPVNSGDVKDTPVLQVLKVHVGVAELLLTLLETAIQVAHRRFFHFFGVVVVTLLPSVAAHFSFYSIINYETSEQFVFLTILYEVLFQLYKCNNQIIKFTNLFKQNNFLMGLFGRGAFYLGSFW